mmetsp:Transcript_41676/g.54886  ORF Transcript_41676/g.54886 Transcript_41676/m.54886 type:complete len:84 (+) Transcript_41676:766-1017(+)|eukprot:CAMPEP_0185582058 /NCGR_PEP_ID=MMETSP0434-20130131/19716_1 /TAXON_ID=626734 ORGANISM="Favella taraikaensis, Strain Fe Narragansett Bay" /NCGR_SAMPLE_ID=MMETSP0434 /ASSEMBLY_ACC=CAM_ASM_000379 /LENGTH=83 /DNA_ID=CAMNT_0028200761 /DNA_START=767 /DNA_END=1018 /DNA_ORIENTATION=+
MLLAEHEAASNARLYDEVEAQAMLEEYEAAVRREICDVKLPMLGMVSNELQKKIDNKMVEQMVFLDRIDALIDRVDKIQDKLN